jgi:hypothetical protein
MSILIYRRTRRLSLLLTLSLFFFLALTELAFAVNINTPTYVPLVGIPGITDTEGLTLAEYINAIYLFTISVGALIGVVKISMAGVKYSMSDVITDKASAKKDIVGVLLGLAILLIPFIVLNTIYPGLTNLDVLKLNDADKLPIDKSKAGSGTATTSADFISSLPKPPFSATGGCTEKLLPGKTPEYNYGECTNLCAPACTQKGGTYKAGPRNTNGCYVGQCTK